MRKMIDSGVEWLGDIPETWDLVQLGSLFSEHKNKNTGMQSNNLLSLSYGNIIRKDINTSDGLLPESFEGYNVIDDGDIVLRLTDLQNDQRSLRVGLSHERGIVTSAYVTLRKRNPAMNSQFFYYLIHSYDVRKGFYGMGAGVRQGLNFAGVRKIMLTLPPADEQMSIADFLEKKVPQVDALIANVQTQIEKLKAYKQSVITEVATKGLDPTVTMKDTVPIADCGTRKAKQPMWNQWPPCQNTEGKALQRLPFMKPATGQESWVQRERRSCLIRNSIIELALNARRKSIAGKRKKRNDSST